MTSALRRYRWRGLNQHGQRQTGYLYANDPSQVSAELAEQKIQFLTLSERRISQLAYIRHRATHKDITQLTQQIATLLATGIALVPALKLVQASHSKAELRSILFRLIAELEAGNTIKHALQQASPWFDDFYLQLVSSGELTGQLAQAFARIGDYREKTQQLKAKIIKALIYPASICTVASGVCYLMLTLVIPEFERMFTSFGATLPWFTRQIVELSHLLQRYSPIGVISLIGIGLALRFTLRQSIAAQRRLSRWSLTLPIFGVLLSKAALAKFSRTLAISCQAGVPILAALGNATATTKNHYYRHLLEQIHLQIAQGSALSLAMKNTQAFPELMMQMLMIGEESGQLDTMLHKIATLYETEVDQQTDNLGQLFEPLLITVIGTLIGALVVAMYLPLFNLMSVLG